MALNVNKSVQDPFYRYKMPRLIAKVEGKGNGVKTVIPNMADIARALGRPPTYCTKYFGCELGAQTQFDFKNERYIVNGAHEAEKLQEMLYGFIKKFVLCEQCDNPETVIKVLTKKGVIVASCKACGHSYNMDITHKLATFIIKNPPEQVINAHGTSLTKKKEKKSELRAKAQTNDNDSPVKNGGGNNNDANEDFADDDDDDDWGVDVSEEAVRQRQKELTSGIQGLTLDADIEKSEVERINLFHDFVKSRVNNKVAVGEKEIHIEAERLEIVVKAPLILCELLLDANAVAQLKKNKRLFQRFTHDNPKAQKYVLGGIEKTIEVYKDALLPKVVNILKTLYDEDLVDEEVLLEWGKKASKKYVSKDLSEQIHKKAEPFLTWLKEAEEESSDEDDDAEENIELHFDVGAKTSRLEVRKEQGNKAKDEKDDDETGADIDIDDI